VRKKIRVENNEHLFDTINNYFKEVIKGNSPEFNEEIKNAIDEWNECDGKNCEECIFAKYQWWVFECEFKNVPDSDLCGFLEQLINNKKALKIKKYIDILDSGLVCPGIM